MGYCFGFFGAVFFGVGRLGLFNFRVIPRAVAGPASVTDLVGLVCRVLLHRAELAAPVEGLGGVYAFSPSD